MTAAAPVLALGALTLHPGRRPAIRGAVASPWPARVALGRPADELAPRMAALHALCSAGHRVAAHLAVRAALGQSTSTDGATREALRRAAIRDHLRRIGHEWPMHWRGRPDLALAPSSAPGWMAAPDDAAALATLPAWLEQHWLGMPIARLLPAWHADPMGATTDWLRTADTPLAALLAPVWPQALTLRTPDRPLRLAQAFGPMPAARPDTGPWAREHDTAAPAADNAAMRLFSRLIDLLHLAQPQGAERLALGARGTADGEGIAWVEVGRGLLTYTVRLAEHGSGPRIAALELRSPTDWNLHPHGVLADALAALPADAPATSANDLALAFDPCVPFSIHTTHRPEPAHA